VAQFATTAVGSITKRRWVAPARRQSRDEMVAFVRRACFTYHHPVGTRAIGPGRDAVVDSELRVRGIQGLRIDAERGSLASPRRTAIGEFASRLVVAERQVSVAERIGEARLATTTGLTGTGPLLFTGMRLVVTAYANAAKDDAAARRTVPPPVS
jgi:hypothetical protein